MSAPSAQSGIDKIKLYTPGEAPKFNAELRKLSSNENLYGPSPKAIEAVKSSASNLWKYPSVDHLELRKIVAEVHDLPESQLIFGVGSDEILYAVAQAYAGQGDEVIMTSHGFEIYGIATHATGADLVVADEVERVVHVDNILAKISDKTKIIYIANPGNPTGTMLENAELVRLAKSIPAEVLLVIDSAYAEFANAYDGGAALVRAQDNVIMTRTFSKLYGLGGLRIGWAFAAQDVIDNLNRIRGPFNLSSSALAGAQAAMRDQEYTQMCREKILQDRKYLRDALLQFGLQIDESHANFLLVRFSSSQRANAAREFLMEKGYLVRSVAHYGLPEALRMTIGTEDDNQALAALMSEFMEIS